MAPEVTSNGKGSGDNQSPPEAVDDGTSNAAEARQRPRRKNSVRNNLDLRIPPISEADSEALQQGCSGGGGGSGRPVSAGVPDLKISSIVEDSSKKEEEVTSSPEEARKAFKLWVGPYEEEDSDAPASPSIIHNNNNQRNVESSPSRSTSDPDEEDHHQLTVSSLSAKPLLSKSGSAVVKKDAGRRLESKKIRNKAKQEEWVAARRRFKPPDGGYAWFVAFGAFMVQFWVAGLIKSFGVLYMEVMIAYPGSSAAVASWIPAILSNLCLSLAPIASALCQRFTCRSVVFVGGVLCCLGLASSFFATNLLHLCLTFGALTGIGAGLSTTPGIVMVARYFDKRRAFANGICVSGTAAGGLVIPWLMEFLVSSYGFRGAILVLGGCVLHVCACAALYRPPSIHQFILEKDEKRRKKELLSQVQVVSIGDSAPTLASNGKCPSIILTTSDSPPLKDKDIMEKNLENLIRTRKISILEAQQQRPIQSQNSCISLMQYYEKRMQVPRSPDVASVNIPVVKSLSVLKDREVECTGGSNKELSVPQVQQVVRRTSFMHSVEDVNTDSTCVYKDRIPDDPSEKEKKEAEAAAASGVTKKKGCMAVCHKYLDLSLMKSPMFLLMVVSVMLMATGCPYALFYVPAYITDSGYSKMDASMLLSVNAILDVIGRLGLGWIFDMNLFKKKTGYVVSVVMSGTAILCFPLATNSFPALCVLISMYGVGLGAWFLLIPVLLAEYYGTEKIASSYGLLRLFQGITALAVPPLAGTMKDLTGEYTTCFYFMGSCMVLGGLLMLLEPLALRLEEKQKKKEEEKASQLPAT